MVDSWFSCYFVFVFLAVFVPFNVLATTTAKKDEVEPQEEIERRQASTAANGEATNDLN